MKKTLLLILVLCLFLYESSGQIVVTKGTFPPICNGVTTYYNQLTDIIIAETNPNDFAIGSCGYWLQSVPYTQLNTGVGQLQFATNGDITGGTINVFANQIININFSIGSNTKIDTIRIKGLQIRSILGAPASFDFTSQNVSACQPVGFSAGQSAMTVYTNNPYVDFTVPSPSQFCPDAAPYQLIGNPAGGVFSGPGVIGNYFNPSNVGGGNYGITYSLSNACSSTITKTVTVSPFKPLISSNKDSICVGESVTFTALGTASFTFFKNNIAVQGPGVSNKYITTQLSQGDNIHVSSSYAGCTNYSDTITIPVNATPTINFTISDYCAGKLPNNFISNVNIPYGTSTINKIEWYADVTTYYPNGNSILHKFTNSGTHTMKSIVTLSSGCTAVKDSSFYMGPFPVARYKWLNVCGTNDVNYIDTSKISAGSIVQWNWDFDRNSTLDINSSTQNPSYTFIAPEAYNSRLIVTSDLGCKDTITRRIVTLEGISVSKSNPYVGDFNVSKAGWNFGDDSLTSWSWGTFNPNTGSATQIISNQNVWHTASTPSGLYNANERSFLNSPCFNFENLTKPMIAIKMGLDTDPSNAGAILEASKDGIVWNRVGHLEEGVYWYNSSGNNGRPGGFSKYSDNLVWSGHYDNQISATAFDGWKVAKVKLDTLAGLTGVRFRIAFGASTGSVTRYTGIALDSVWIGDRNKIITIENFTQTYITNDVTGAPILAAKNSIDYIRDQRKKDVSAIYYHTSFPKVDNFNTAYPAGPSSRVLYYGVTGVPRTVLDGNYYNGNIYSGGTSSSRLDINDVDSRILERAEFRLDVSTSLNSGVISANSKIVYINPDKNFSFDLVLHTVVVEDSAGGDNRFSSVARQMLPDAAGDYIRKTWTFNDSITLGHTWNYGALSPSKFGVVNFLQDANTKEIYQSVYVRTPGNSGIPVVLDVTENKIENSSILVFPNPADNEISIVTLSDNENIENWTLIDNLGRELRSGTLDKNEKSVSFNTSDITTGLHYIRITLTNGNTFLKKILINH